MSTRLNALADAFRVRDERMRGLPVHNPALKVEIVEAREWRDFYIGILITPWCMNLVLLPRLRAGAEAAPAGTRRDIELPCGRSTFLAGDPALGEPYWACSLFSPVLNFPDQAAARAVAQRIMAGLLLLPETLPARQEGIRRKVTRRELIGGGAPD